MYICIKLCIYTYTCKYEYLYGAGGGHACSSPWSGPGTWLSHSLSLSRLRSRALALSLSLSHTLSLPLSHIHTSSNMSTDQWSANPSDTELGFPNLILALVYRNKSSWREREKPRLRRARPQRARPRGDRNSQTLNDSGVYIKTSNRKHKEG